MNPEYGKVIAKTILKTLESVFNDEFNYTVGLGIGGPHYCSNFIKIYDSSNYAISHICPKYALLDISLETIKEAVLKSSIKPEIVFLDWKGLGGHKQKIREITNGLEKSGLKIVKTSSF
jgi:D-tyrosyl-tRNA(Tyr) deacylase